MIDQECWELTDNVHNICCNLCLTILGIDTFAQIEQFFDDIANKFVFIICPHAP